jgi:hypothetical protein
MTDVYTDQAIYDAIVAAITSFGPGEFNVNVQKFIDTFNNHRDRKLCTSLDVAQTPVTVLIESADELYSACCNITAGTPGFVEAMRSYASASNAYRSGAAQTPPMNLPEIPDNDADFTPDLARKIIAQYQAIIAMCNSDSDPFMEDYKRDTVNGMAHRIHKLEAALREIDNMAPATCEVTLAHQMADIASAALASTPLGD